MKVEIEHFSGERPSFNVKLLKEAGEEPFLIIKGCRIADGSKGPFVSWPSTKNASSGKWWQHCFASDSFNDYILSLANHAQRRAVPRAPARQSRADLDDAPF